jgi:hypothetical protein
MVDAITPLTVPEMSVLCRPQFLIIIYINHDNFTSFILHRTLNHGQTNTSSARLLLPMRLPIVHACWAAGLPPAMALQQSPRMLRKDLTLLSSQLGWIHKISSTKLARPQFLIIIYINHDNFTSFILMVDAITPLTVPEMSVLCVLPSNPVIRVGARALLSVSLRLGVTETDP